MEVNSNQIYMALQPMMDIYYLYICVPVVSHPLLAVDELIFPTFNSKKKIFPTLSDEIFYMETTLTYRYFMVIHLYQRKVNASYLTYIICSNICMNFEF